MPRNGSRWSSIGVLVFLGLLVFAIGFAELKVVKPMCLHAEGAKNKEGMLSNWDLAENSYNDDDCVDTWDELTGGIKSVLSFDRFKDIDRKKLLEQEAKPDYSVCIKRAANYTLECPNETLYVTGCDGKQYKNACFAERDGIYAYTTENGVMRAE